MIPIENYIFGNGATGGSLHAITEILLHFMSNAPDAVSIAQLEWATGRAARELDALCASLDRAGLVRQARETGDKWRLSCDTSSVTLEDVFRCVLAEQQGCNRSFLTAAPQRAPDDIDLMLMQAVITIDESLQHLRKFPLERLNARTSLSFSSRHQGHGNASPFRSGIAEPEGN